MSAPAPAPPGIAETLPPKVPECLHCVEPTEMRYMGCYGAGDPVQYSHGWECCLCHHRTFFSAADYSPLRREPVPA